MYIHNAHTTVSINYKSQKKNCMKVKRNKKLLNLIQRWYHEKSYSNAFKNDFPIRKAFSQTIQRVKD